MTPPIAQGYPDYKALKAIADVYSLRYQTKFYHKSPIALMTNSDFSADVNKPGDKVIIPVIPTTTIKSYTVGGTMEPENPQASPIEFPMNQASYFYIMLDKITKHQMVNGKEFIDKCTQDAGEQTNIYISNLFLADIVNNAHSQNQGNAAGSSGDIKLGTTGTFPTITAANVLKYIIACQVVGDQQQWPDEGRWITLPSLVAGCIQLSDLKDANLTGDAITPLRHGKVGRIGKMTVILSDQVASVTDTGSTVYKIPFGHSSAIGFGSKVIESVYFDKFEKQAGEGIRVLNLFDWKVVNDKGLGVLYAAADLGLE